MSKRYQVRRYTSAYTLNWLDSKTNKKLKAVEIEEIINQQDQRIAELEEQLKKSLESNNDLLKQIMELEAQLIKERLKGENK